MVMNNFCTHYPGCCVEKEEVEEVAPEFVLTQAAQDELDSNITKNQLKLVEEARDIGFLVRVRRSLIWVNDQFQKQDGKNAKAGELTKAAHSEDVLSVAGAFPSSALRFVIFWNDGKPGGGFVWDPIGKHIFLKYDYKVDELNWAYNQVTEDNSQNERLRITSWAVGGQTELAEWMDQWRKLIKGKSRAEEKDEARLLAILKKRAAQAKIYRKYLDDDGVEYQESDFE